MNVRILVSLCLALMTFFSRVAIAGTERVGIYGDHGVLAAILQVPEGVDEYPLVMLLHGFNGHKDSPILTGLADSLEARDIASIRFDFNGHGESSGKFSDMTVPSEISDARRVYRYARKLPGVTSISIVGHSQGGVVAAMLAGELGDEAIRSVVLLAPSAILRDDCIRGRLLSARFDPFDPPQILQVSKRYDVWVGRRYIETLRDLPIYETAEKYKGPVCIIHGDHDVTVPYTDSLRFDRILEDSELHILNGLDHMFEPDRDAMTRLAADFLGRKARGGARSAA